MANCKHLKIKINRKFECKKTNKIIDIRKCNKNDCKHFEYKEKEYKNLPKFSESSTGKHNSNISAENNTELSKTMQRKSNSHQIKKKSSKLAKLERNRYSVFTDDLEHCIICGKKKEHIHEVFPGAYRQRSMKEHMVLPLCAYHHIQIHEDIKLSLYWKRSCQKEYEKSHSREKFIEIFGRSYLK